MTYGFNVQDKLEDCTHEIQNPYEDLDFLSLIYKSIGFSVGNF